MKKIIFALPVLVAFYFTPGCTKNNNTINTVYDTTYVIYKDTIVVKDTLVLTNAKYPITGYWAGLYTIDGAESYGEFYYGWDIFADHTLIQRGGGSNGDSGTAKGTWTLSADSTLTADIVPTDPSQGSYGQHISAKYSPSAGTLSQGKYTYTSGKTETGSFSLQRVE